MLARESATSPVPDARTLLLGVPSLSTRDRSCCATHLAAAGADPHVLHVDFVRRPAYRARQWANHPSSPASLSVVRVRARAASDSDSSAPGAVEVRDDVADPSDLTTLGMRLVDALEAVDDGPTAVCLHSATTLLQYVSTPAAERFLGRLVDLTDEYDARCHAHVEPGAHTADELEPLRSVFDATFPFEDANVVDGDRNVVDGDRNVVDGDAGSD